MARTSVQTAGSNSFQTTAEDLNALATDFISDGIVGALTNTTGVAPATGGLSANAQGSPDRTVAIGTGIAYVTATPNSQASQRLRVKIDAQNVTHATNTSGGTRFDWIYVKLDPTLAANPAVAGDTTGTMVISRSTSSSVDNGTPPTYGKNVAIVTLTNNYTTIVNGNIADTRTQTGPNSLDRSTSNIVQANQLATNAITLGYVPVTGNQTSTSASGTQLTGYTAAVTIPAGGRKIKITVYISQVSAGVQATYGVSLWDGTVGSGTQLQAATVSNNVGGTTSANLVVPVTLVAVVTPAAGAKTYNVGGFTSTGTMTAGASATTPGFILVEVI